MIRESKKELRKEKTHLINSFYLYYNKMELTKRESLKSDVTESLNADTKAEASRDDVYKRL